MFDIQIENRNGVNVVSSRVIAKELKKDHRNILRDIDNIIKEGCSDLSTPKYFLESKYIHIQNKQQYREYLLTKDGFTIYMFNIQGYNDFKMAYINRFNEMERALQEQQPMLPKTYKEALQQLLVQVEENERLQLENNEMKPKAEFFDSVANSKTAIQMGEVAKVLDMGIGRNKLFEVLRKKGVLMHNNIPYQKYIDNGYFRVIETKFTKPNGDTCVNIKTLVYQKGINYIRKIVEKVNE